MIEFDLDKTGYFSISEKGAFDMVDAQIILTPNEVEELKKALTLTDVVGRSEQLKALEDLKDFAYDNCQPHNSDMLSEIMERL